MGRRFGHVLLITRAHVPDLKLGVGGFVESWFSWLVGARLYAPVSRIVLRCTPSCQLDYALAVRGQESTETLEIWIKSSEPSSSRSWKLSTVQITQPLTDKAAVKYSTWDTHGFHDIRRASLKNSVFFMSFWHFLQSKHVLREGLLNRVQVPEKCRVICNPGG